MLNKIRNSFVFRSGTIYRRLCNILPNPKYKHGPVKNFTLVSMVGKGQLDMLNSCLISLHNSWTSRPNIIIYSDGSVEIEKIEQTLKWWKGNMEVKSAEELYKWSILSEEKGIIDFVRKEAMGRKMACILKESELTPVLWCDSDFLWYKELYISNSTQSLEIIASEDYQASYDGYISDYCPQLKDKPYLCMGLVYVKGNVRSIKELQLILPLLGDQPNHFTEQTFFAIALKTIGGKVWKPEEIALFQSDKFSIKPSFIDQNWICRHYVGPVRHIFWRDSFFLHFRQNKIYN
jgi:hypothetical protein